MGVSRSNVGLSRNRVVDVGTDSDIPDKFFLSRHQYRKDPGEAVGRIVLLWILRWGKEQTKQFSCGCWFFNGGDVQQG